MSKKKETEEKEPERCPECNRKLRVHKAKRTSRRLIHSGRSPTKEQMVEISVTLKLCACGYTDKDESEKMLKETEI